MNRRLYIALLVLASAVSCSKTLEEGGDAINDGRVHIEVATYQDADTRTAYSGEVVGAYERINWQSGVDRIRVISNLGVTKSGDKQADYLVVANARTNQAGLQKSEAEAEALVSGKDLYWKASGSDHYFFGLYPVPSSDSDFVLGAGKNTAVVSGSVPSVQAALSRTETVSGGVTTYEYLPDMTNAYMYAGAHVAGTSVGAKKVMLLYKPLFTAFKFVIKAGDTASRNYKLKKLTLTSADGASGSDLYGSFTAEVGLESGHTGDILSVTPSSAGRSVSIALNMTEALAGNTVVATLLALPLDQTRLTIDVEFEDNSGNTRHRKLNLQNKQLAGAPWVTLKAPRKLVVNMNLVDIEYVFEVTQELNQFHPDGSLETDYYHVSSYRKRYNAVSAKDEYEAWPWDAVEYNTGDGWKAVKPAWLELEAYTGDGKAPVGDPVDLSTAPVSYDAEVAQTYDLAADDVWLNLGNSTPETAIDLSNYDFMTQAAYPGRTMQGKPSDTPYETANCYVVSGPGWYKIPLVWGNAYQQGAINRKAYYPSDTYSEYIMNRFWASGWMWLDEPWITRDGGHYGMGLSSFRHPHLLWQDVEDMVYVPQFDPDGTADNDKGQKILLQGSEERNSWCEDHYLYFRVDNLANRAGGNAVISLSDEYGTIMWSWHIWAVPKSVLKTQKVYYWMDPMYAAVGSEPANTTPPSRLSYNDMLDLNLGYVAGKPARYCLVKFRQKTSGNEAVIHLMQMGDATTASAVHYQWGRKDPMFSVGGLKSQNYAKTIWFEDGTTVSSENLPTHSAGSTCYWDWPYNYIPDSMANPYTQYTIDYSGPFTWSGERFDNLWDGNIFRYAKQPAEHFDGYYVSKTVYDPCPPGFKVPNEYAFTGFNLQGMDANVDATTLDGEGNFDPTLVINGLRASFYIGDQYKAGEPFGSQGMYLYCDPRDKDNGLAFFPALGRRVGFGADAGKLSGMYAEALYWTAAPFYDDALYARNFTMRRSLTDGSTTEGYPQCIPVYTVAAAPSSIPYSGFLRAHGCQVRPVRDRYEDAHNIPYEVVSVDISVPGGRNVNISITL